jgi:flavin reductase (NADH)
VIQAARSAGAFVPDHVFRSLMSDFPSGVSVVTTSDGGRPYGMTCSSLCSVTVTPATLLVCLRAESTTLAAVLRQGTFALNLLHSGSQSVAERFGSGAGEPDRFDLVRWHPGTGGPHLTEDAHAIADCRVSRTMNGGSHLVVLAEVVQVSQWGERSPLVYGRRRYSAWPH